MQNNSARDPQSAPRPVYFIAGMAVFNLIVAARRAMDLNIEVREYLDAAPFSVRVHVTEICDRLRSAVAPFNSVDIRDPQTAPAPIIGPSVIDLIVAVHRSLNLNSEVREYLDAAPFAIRAHIAEVCARMQSSLAPFKDVETH